MVSILKGFKLNLGRKYEVFTADSGSEGLRILEEEGPIQVIVSDFAMPRMNGVDFLEKLGSRIRKGHYASHRSGKFYDF